MHRAGFAHRAAVEYDADAALTLSNNLARLGGGRNGSAPLVITGDVTLQSTWDPDTFRGVDLLAGGPPCPPFSDAGQRLGAGDERDLYAWSIGLVARIRPRALLLENVRGLSSPRFAGYRQAVADRLTELGYVPERRMIHANDFGVPQTRPRFVLVAVAEADAPYFTWPGGSPGDTLTVGRALHDLMAADGWPGADT